MHQNKLIITTFMHITLLTSITSAMDLTPPKEYTATIEDAAKALIIIQAICLDGRKHHLKIKPSPSNKLQITASVAAKDVELQEKQYTETPFLPFFVDQNSESREVSIKPYTPGFYSILIPQNTTFTASIPQGTVDVDDSLKAFDLTKK